MLRDPVPARPGRKGGRPCRHGSVLAFARPETWHEPDVIAATDTTRYGKADTRLGTGCTPGSPNVAPGRNTRRKNSLLHTARWCGGKSSDCRAATS